MISTMRKFDKSSNIKMRLLERIFQSSAHAAVSAPTSTPPLMLSVGELSL